MAAGARVRPGAAPFRREAVVADFDDVRRIGLALPGAHEVIYRGDPWLNVGKKSFALNPGGRCILKLDKAHQELLFEIRPETFSKCPVATVWWSYVELSHLDQDELADLVRQAWAQVVPKQVSAPVLTAAAAERRSLP